MRVLVTTTFLLVCSNIFMTFAWYAHLRNLRDKPWLIAVGISWGIAFFEYVLQVPANRLGYSAIQLSQLSWVRSTSSFGHSRYRIFTTYLFEEASI
jgi:uncharacterized protein (DUF486 family)